MHISELSDHFVKDPLTVVKVGDVLEFSIIGLDQDRRRISLSRKSGQEATKPSALPAEKQTVKAPAKPGAAKAVVIKTHNAAKFPAQNKPYSGPGKNTAEHNSQDDGTMYNPFAEAFRNMRKK